MSKKITKTLKIAQILLVRKENYFTAKKAKKGG